MKTIEYLKTEIKLNFGRKKIFLKDVLMYLETNPRKEFLQNEKARLEKIIKAKNAKYEYWLKNVVSHEVLEKDRRNLFNRETGITSYKRFLKTINYILSPVPATKKETEQQPIKNIKNVNRRKNSKQNTGVKKQGFAKENRVKDKDKALLIGLFLINDIVVIKNQTKLLK